MTKPKDKDKNRVSVVSPHDITKLLLQSGERHKARVEKERKARRERDEPTSAHCVACNGVILRRLRHKHVHFDHNTPIGCGSRDPDDLPPRPYIDGYHCKRCGLEYHHLPGQQPAKEEEEDDL